MFFQFQDLYIDQLAAGKGSFKHVSGESNSLMHTVAKATGILNSDRENRVSPKLCYSIDRSCWYSCVHMHLCNA